jgi:hypothetical protein
MSSTAHSQRRPVRRPSPEPVAPQIPQRAHRPNAGGSGCFIEFVGNQGDQTAVAGTGIYLAAGATRVFSTNGATFLAAIGDAGSTILYITPGTGL